MLFIWNEVLFRPLLNLLIGLYNTIGLENLGLAIIWLTIMVRILLLPSSLRNEKRRQKRAELQSELKKLEVSYSNVPSVLREEQRALLKQYRFRRWPIILNLSVQGLILLVLYQVFVGGIKLQEIVDSLYSFVDVPVAINTVFLGIDIAQRSLILSLVPGVLLFIGIVIEQRRSGRGLNRKDMLYAFGFPAGTVLLLLYLPAVKAVFIATSLIFTDTLRILTAFRKSIKEQDVQIKQKSEEAKVLREAGLPHPKERFK